MGYRTVALSRGPSKRDFAVQLGATDYIDTSARPVADALQELGGAALIVCTAPNPELIQPLMNGLGPGGKLLNLTPVGPVAVDTVGMVLKGLSFCGWPSGHARDCEEAIAFAEELGVKCMVESFPLKDANEVGDFRRLDFDFPAKDPSPPSLSPFLPLETGRQHKRRACCVGFVFLLSWLT